MNLPHRRLSAHGGPGKHGPPCREGEADAANRDAKRDSRVDGARRRGSNVHDAGRAGDRRSCSGRHHEHADPRRRQRPHRAAGVRRAPGSPRATPWTASSSSSTRTTPAPPTSGPRPVRARRRTRRHRPSGLPELLPLAVDQRAASDAPDRHPGRPGRPRRRARPARRPLPRSRCSPTATSSTAPTSRCPWLTPARRRSGSSPMPLPDSTIKGQVFADNAPTNGASTPASATAEGLRRPHQRRPRRGARPTSTATRLCTTYEGEDPVTHEIPLAASTPTCRPSSTPLGGNCVSDADGIVTFPHLGTNRYTPRSRPPTASSGSRRRPSRATTTRTPG